MSKFTQCSKCLHALLNIKIDAEPEYDFFLARYFEVGALDAADHRTPIDPRKSSYLLKEFEHLLSKREYSNTVRSFKRDI